MNPKSPEAVTERAAIHRKAIAYRDQLAGEACSNPSYESVIALKRAEAVVRSSLVRMEVMGDPLPEDPPVAKVSGLPAPIISPSLQLANPTTAEPHSEPEPEPERDPIDAIARRIAAA